MLKKLVVAFLLCLTSIIVYAQDGGFLLQKLVLCSEAQPLIKILVEKHGEKPVATGLDTDKDFGYTMFINPKTQTWTFLQFDKEIACVLGFGINGKLTVGNKI